jgi:hypothetical protein
MLRVVEHRFGGTYLDEFAEVHDPDSTVGLLGEVFGVREVVRDEQIGGVELVLQFDHQVHHLDAEAHVQRRDCLVGEDEVRIHQQRPDQGDSLLLSARELVGIPARVILGWCHPDVLQEAEDPFLPVSLVEVRLPLFQRVSEDRLDGVVGVERAARVLVDHLERATDLREGDRRGVVSAEQSVAVSGLPDALATVGDSSCCRSLDTDGRLAERRLATAGLPDECDDVVLVDRQRNVVDSVDLFRPDESEQALVLEVNGNAIEGDDVVRFGTHASSPPARPEARSLRAASQ